MFYGKSIMLNDKVDEFIKWYYQNMVKKYYTYIDGYYQPLKMRNFIEKMAIWYELKYPDYKVCKLIPCSIADNKSEIDDIYLKNSFYDIETFKNLLSSDELSLLETPRYYKDLLVYVGKNNDVKLYINDGIIKRSTGFSLYTNGKLRDDDIENYHIRDVKKLLKSKKVKLPVNNELFDEIDRIRKVSQQRLKMLNCVMYRIIERGGPRIGPRRALLFAKEFNRSIDIPMKYGVDYSDPGLGRLINSYLNLGGSLDLLCYGGYFNITDKCNYVDIVSLKKLILMLYNETDAQYMPKIKEVISEINENKVPNIKKIKLSKNKH